MKAVTTALLLLSCFIVSQASFSADEHFRNPPGWSWKVEPMEIDIGSGLSVNGVLFLSSFDQNGAFNLTVGWKPEERTRYRAVIYDSSRQRRLSDWSVGPGTDDMTLTRYTWNEIELENITYVGFEALTPDGALVVSENALKRARAKGIRLLPYPTIGRTYSFELSTLDGRTIKSENFLGKVVVIDCWATWCKPCMKKIPDIQAFQLEQNKDHLEVIGINFDQKAELLKKAIDQHDIQWPTVHVPTDPESRGLWFDASSIGMLPRLFVLDKKGILRLDTDDTEALKSTVKKLIKE